MREKRVGIEPPAGRCNVIHRTSYPGVEGGPGETEFFRGAQQWRIGRFGPLVTEPPHARRYGLWPTRDQVKSGMGVRCRFGTWAVLAVLVGATAPPLAHGGQPVELAVTGRDGRPMAGVVLYLPDVRTPAAQLPAVVDQRGEAFVPVVSVVSAGSEVQFTNSDRTSHHVYSFSRPNAFALPLYKGDARLSARFQHAGVVVLGCNIHDSMLGYVVVVESTRYGTTGADGHLKLADVPAGRRVIRAWAPGLDREDHPEIGVIEVGESAPASASFRLDLTGRADSGKRRGSLVGRDY